MLLSAIYNDYVQDIITFTYSIVLKSSQSITINNNFLKILGDEISDDPRDWAYYKNIRGLRYIGSSGRNSDPLIQVYSLDKNIMIDFNPSTLVDNPLTKNDFLTYGDSFKNLLAQYPNHELLIRSVLNPVLEENIQTAIDAPDYTILNYDSNLIEVNEEKVLISKLQNWLYIFNARWYKTAFYVTNSLYPASILGITADKIVLTIISLRLESCKTPYAHSFHVWNYLANYFNIDKYKGIIPLNQALFLYRNIDYITANSGKKFILDFLNDEFAKPYGLELYSFSIRKNIGNSLEYLNNKQYDKLTYEVSVSQYPYNAINFATAPTEVLEPKKLSYILRDSAILNSVEMDKNTTKLLTAVKSTPLTEIPTGIIEAIPNVDVISALVSKTQEQLNYWIYLSSKNNELIEYKYKLVLPSDDIDIILNSRDALVLMLYATSVRNKDPFTTIPTVKVNGIMVPPSNFGLDDTRLLELIESNVNANGMVNVLNVLNSTQTYPPAAGHAYSLITLSVFNTFIDNVVNSKVIHKLLPSCVSKAISKSEITFLAEQFYRTIDCDLSNGPSNVTESTIDQVLDRLGIGYKHVNGKVYPNISNNNLDSMIQMLCSNFAGIEPETITLQSPYSEMVDILSLLCSYNLTFVKGASTNNMIPIDWSFVTVYQNPATFIMGKVMISSDIDIDLDKGITITAPDKIDADYAITSGLIPELSVDFSFTTDITCSVQVDIDTYLNDVSPIFSNSDEI